MAREMTPQERAEDVYYGLQVMNAPEHNLRAADNERDVQAIVTLITETRQAALLECVQQLREGARLAQSREVANALSGHAYTIDRLAQEG